MRSFVINFLAFSCFFLVSCHHSKTQDKTSFTEIKQDHKIERLRSQIKAQREISRETEMKIAELKEELYIIELEVIKKKVRDFKKENSQIESKENLSSDALALQVKNFFLEDRKILTNIIEDSITHRKNAQVILDDILELITKFNGSLDRTKEAKNGIEKVDTKSE